MRKRRQEWRELLEWFVAENRAILAARDGNGRWRPVEFFRPEKIAKSTRKLSELVGLIARSWWWEIPVGSAEFSRLRESALEVLVGLRCLLDDEYGIVRWMEFWERVFFRMMAWNRPLMVILAKVEVRTRLMQRHLESPLVYIGLALAAMEELPRVRVASVEEPAVAEIAKGIVPRLGGRPRKGRQPAFTQKAVAVLCGKSEGTVAGWENGRIKPPFDYRAELRVKGGVEFFDWVREYNAHNGVADIFVQIQKGNVVYTEGLTEREKGLVEEHIRKLRQG